MDHIVEIVSTFKEEELKEFKSFIGRLRKKDNRKDTELLDILLKSPNLKGDELIEYLYPDSKNKEAYHATRKRLIKQLNEFIYLNEIKNDSTLESKINGYIFLCKYLFKHKKHATAWAYFRKAQSLAEKGKYYTLLNIIFSLGIEYSLSPHAEDIDYLISEKKKYLKKSITEENAKTANFVIQNRLQKAAIQGDKIDVSQTVKEVLVQYNLHGEIEDDPRLIYNIIEITRKAALSLKDFYSFEPYLIEKYNNLLANNSFDKFTHVYKIKLLYFIAHVLYRNKNFSLSEKYTNDLYDAFHNSDRTHYNEFYPRYILLKANICIYTNRLIEAKNILTTVLKEKQFESDKIQVLNMQIVLSTVYFYAEDYQNTIKAFIQINHSDSWYTKVMGKEWVLKKQLLDIMSQYELGNTDLVENRIRYTKKTYEDFLRRDEYKKIKSFLEIVRKFNNNPMIIKTKSFLQEVNTSFVFMPREIEDLQAITFYCWIKSKMSGRKFYDVLVEVANPSN